MKNKEKYDLSKLKLETVSYDGKTKRMTVYETSSYTKELFEKQYAKYVYPYELLVDFANWLEQEYVPKILTDKETAYLSAVIKPFREEVETIEKTSFSGYEQLQISDRNTVMAFPCFEKGTMYKGMEAYKAYTLEELGL